MARHLAEAATEDDAAASRGRRRRPGEAYPRQGAAGILDDHFAGAAARGKRLGKSQRTLRQVRPEISRSDQRLGGLAVGGADRLRRQQVDRPDGLFVRHRIVHQDDVAARDADAFAAVAVGRRHPGGKAEREGERVLRAPFDLDDRLPVVAAEGMIQRVDGRRYLGQSHRLAMTRVGVGRIAGLGTDDLLEDQDVARFEAQGALASRAALRQARPVAPRRRSFPSGRRASQRSRPSAGSIRNRPSCRTGSRYERRRCRWSGRGRRRAVRRRRRFPARPWLRPPA